MWTDGSGKSCKRFSLLLLQEREHYIQDWIATCMPPRNARWNSAQFKGLIRLCSKSVFFEPYDLAIPILMFPLDKVVTVEQQAGTSSLQRSGGGFLMKTSVLVKMKKNGVDSPYEFDKSESTWCFTLDYAPAKQFLQQAQHLFFVNSLPPSERDIILQNAAAQKEAQAQFDISRLKDFNEEVLFNYPAAQVTPLVREPGRLVVSESCLYFQPLHNLNNDSPVRSQPLTSIVAVARRRYCLRHTGVEIFFKNANALTKGAGNGGLFDVGTAFFTFQSVEECNDAVTKLLRTLQARSGLPTAVGSLLDKNGSWLDRVTSAWQAGRVSNYDYLMYLNLVAGRTHCDLAQWPVMPWVLKDYESPVLDLEDVETFRDLSQPIGALNAERLAIYQERFRQMPADGSDPPFLYGTHYSAPGYVLYWLVRSAPGHMLRLQNGRFDSPDRLFVSMLESWRSVLTNHADVKELIPEFYAFPSDFLVTRTDLNLGVRQNGSRVGDVQLPPWSKDADDFILKHRSALECQHVSVNLHRWIDLIFGFKQRGEAALAANNVFHHLTYEGAVDLEAVQDPFERMSLEAQINEFGQAPQQLFTGPHPSSFGSLSHLGNQSHGKAGNLYAEILSRVMLHTVSFEKGAVIDPDVADSTILDFPVAAGGFSSEEDTSTEEVPVPQFEDMHINSCYEEPTVCTTPQTPLEATRFGTGTHSRSSTSRSLSSAQMRTDQAWTLKSIVESQPWTVHREPVNAVLVSDENASQSTTLYCASSGGLIKVYSVTEGFQIRATKIGTLPISSLALARSGDAYPTVLAGSYDNCVWAYSVDYGRPLGKVNVHDDTVSCVRVTCDDSRMVTASWDATVKIWRLDEARGGWTNASAPKGTFAAAELELGEHDCAVWSADVDKQGQLVTSGAEDGTVILWDTRTPGSVWTSKELPSSAAAMRLSSDGRQLIVASASGHLYALEVGVGGAVSSEKDCGVPLKSCELLDSVALVGSSNGELHFWRWNSPASPQPQTPNPRCDHSDAITSIAVGGRHMPSMVVTSSEDSTVQVYRVECCD